MRLTVAGRTVRVGYPGIVLGALVVAFLLVLAGAGLTSGAAFGAYNADWTGTSDLRRVADASDRTVVVGGDGTSNGLFNPKVRKIVEGTQPSSAWTNLDPVADPK